MSLMDRCPHGNCYELKPVDAADCGNHASNQPLKRICGICRVREAKYHSTMCHHCQKKKYRNRERPAGETLPLVKPSKARDEGMIYQPWTPKPKIPQRMTDAAQKRHDKELEQRLAKECGYGHGEARRLSKEEIERIQGQITHISRVKDQSYGAFNCWQ